MEFSFVKMKRKFFEWKMKMKLKLQILIATIIVLAVYVPAARAQANLTFSGGGGTPLSITLQQTVSYTLTAACRNPAPVFKNTNISFPFTSASGTMTFSINGGAARNFSVASGNTNFGDITANDIFINYPTSAADPTLPIGTTFVLNPGTLTTSSNVAATPPAGGSYTTFLVCGNTDGLRISNNGTIPTAASVSVSGRVLTNVNRGLMNAVVYLTDASGNTLAARTNPFGYYRFEDISAGQTVTITVVSKRYQFAPQIFTVMEEINDLDFVALAPLREK
jgi:hypothetical protein